MKINIRMMLTTKMMIVFKQFVRLFKSLLHMFMFKYHSHIDFQDFHTCANFC